jgi:hypothetical protein
VRNTSWLPTADALELMQVDRDLLASQTMRLQRRRLPSDQTPRRGFIHAYGLFWSADEINWFRTDEDRSRFRMLGRLGRRGPNLRVCDFRFQRGIYVLYDDYGPYYVGLVRVGTLGNRLKQHRLDQHADSWDRFSWFGFAPVIKRSRYADGTSVLGKLPERLLTDSRWAIRDLEALLIQSLGTQNRGNSHQMRFGQGEHWTQVMAHEVDDYLDRLKKPPPSRARNPEPSQRARRSD